jgi:hypothetical protein
MNGYYRRKSSLPFEEIRPLEFDEIEFVSDVGEGQEEDLLRECLICGEEVGLNEDEEILDDEECFCERCCRYTNEYKKQKEEL